MQFQQVDPKRSLPKRLLQAPSALRKPITAADMMCGLNKHRLFWLSVMVSWKLSQGKGFKLPFGHRGFHKPIDLQMMEEGHVTQSSPAAVTW